MFLQAKPMGTPMVPVGRVAAIACVLRLAREHHGNADYDNITLKEH